MIDADPSIGAMGSYDPAAGVGLIVSGPLADDVLVQIWLRVALANP